VSSALYTTPIPPPHDFQLIWPDVRLVAEVQVDAAGAVLLAQADAVGMLAQHIHGEFADTSFAGHEIFGGGRRLGNGKGGPLIFEQRSQFDFVKAQTHLYGRSDAV